MYLFEILKYFSTLTAFLMNRVSLNFSALGFVLSQVLIMFLSMCTISEILQKLNPCSLRVLTCLKSSLVNFDYNIIKLKISVVYLIG